MSSTGIIKVLAIVLLIAIAVPGLIFGILVSPYFFLFCLALALVPLLFLRPSQPATKRKH